MSSNELISRLNAAVSALGDVDVSGWDDSALRDHLAELSVALCRVDAQLSRLADEVRSRGFRIVEPAPSPDSAPSPDAVPATTSVTAIAPASAGASADDSARAPVAA